MDITWIAFSLRSFSYIKIALLFLLVNFLSCKENEKDRLNSNCKCKLENVYDALSDSIVNYENDESGYAISPSIDGKIKNIISIELGSQIRKNASKVNFERILGEIFNDPQYHHEFKLFYQYKRAIYCEYFERVCESGVMEISEFNIIMNQKLNEIDSVVVKYFSTIYQPNEDYLEKKPISKPLNTFNLISLNDELKNEIEMLTGFTYSTTSSRIISFNITGDLNRLDNEKGLYFFSGGKVLISISGMDCPCSFENSLPRSSNYGNSKEFIEDSNEKGKDKIINENLQTIARCISFCLK